MFYGLACSILITIGICIALHSILLLHNLFYMINKDIKVLKIFSR
jgi:hypothetical protein